MKLYDLLENTIKISSMDKTLLDANIQNITDNSKMVGKGILFICVKGKSFDGHDFAREAIEMGAAAVVVEKDMGIKEQIVVKDTRICYGELCASWWGHPERRLKLIGVTGTNGKTTITKMIKEVLTANGHVVGLIGTTGNEIGDEFMPTENTTPFAYDFMKLLSEMAKKGCDCVVMEVSSFALDQCRIGVAHFRIAIFSNLTQDHLDYHGTFEKYYQAKKRLFSRCDLGIVNVDDEMGMRLNRELNCNKITYSCNKADFYARDIVVTATSISYQLCYGEKTLQVDLAMSGSFNVSNSLAVIAACSKLGIPMDRIVEAISKVHGVKGRCEVVETGMDFTVILDYAHTDNALENILSSVKTYTENRLICLFGCGGNRDKTKRPLMLKSAAKYADLLVITSDNPRDEEPLDIIKDILCGLDGTDTPPHTVINDRREAIEYAIKIAQKGDIIVLAGKGHEDYQVLRNGVHIHFDEHEIVSEICAKMEDGH